MMTRRPGPSRIILRKKPGYQDQQQTTNITSGDDTQQTEQTNVQTEKIINENEQTVDLGNVNLEEHNIDPAKKVKFNII
jgi:hypothetical protein